MLEYTIRHRNVVFLEGPDGGVKVDGEFVDIKDPYYRGMIVPILDRWIEGWESDQEEQGELGAFGQGALNELRRARRVCGQSKEDK